MEIIHFKMKYYNFKSIILNSLSSIWLVFGCRRFIPVQHLFDLIYFDPDVTMLPLLFLKTIQDGVDNFLFSHIPIITQ